MRTFLNAARAMAFGGMLSLFLASAAAAAPPSPIRAGADRTFLQYDEGDSEAVQGLRENWVRITVATQEASPCQESSCTLFINLDQLRTQVTVQPVDVNDDGETEYILRSSLCDENGCPFALVIRRAGVWRDALDQISATGIVVLDSRHGVMRDLQISRSSPRYGSDTVLYAWDGAAYSPQVGGRGGGAPFGQPAAPSGPFGPPGGGASPGETPFGRAGGPGGDPYAPAPTPVPRQTRYAFTPDNPTIPEGAGTFTFIVTRSGDLPAETVFVSTVMGAKGGFARNDGDYVGKRNEAVVFAAGAKTSPPILLTVTPDTLDEPDETFGLILESDPGKADNRQLAATRMTIADDDEPAKVVDPNLIPGAGVDLWAPARLDLWRAAGAALTYAKLSAAIYLDSAEIDGWTRVASWQDILRSYYAPITSSDKYRLLVEAVISGVNYEGFDAALYRRIWDGKVQYALVFRGTDGLLAPQDWYTNFTQLAGVRLGNQYDFGLQIARMVQEQYGQAVVTGHSLGGGIAQYVAWKLPGWRAVSFNSAGLGGVPANTQPIGSIVNVTMGRDPVSKIGTQLGLNKYEIPNPTAATWAADPGDLLNAHGGKDLNVLLSALVITWSDGALAARRAERAR